MCLAVNHGMTFLRDDEVADLLECLMLNGDPAQKKCSGFDAILRHFPKKENKSTLVNSLWQLCSYVIDNRSEIFHWLFAVPLLHFLSDAAEPFSTDVPTASPSSAKDNSWWGTQDMNFQRVRNQAEIFRSV